MNVCLKRIGYGSRTCTVLGLENIELCPYFAESSLAVVMNPASIGGSISASGDSGRSGGPRGRRGHGWFSWSSWSSWCSIILCWRKGFQYGHLVL